MPLPLHLDPHYDKITAFESSKADAFLSLRKAVNDLVKVRRFIKKYGGDESIPQVACLHIDRVASELKRL